MEGGVHSAGSGQDIAFLKNDIVQNHIGILGIEPVVFMDEDTGVVSMDNATSCLQQLQGIGPVLQCVSPDIHMYKAVLSHQWNGLEVGVRDGPQGSIFIDVNYHRSTIPAASLSTSDGKPRNPTGAENANSAALMVCRGMGEEGIHATYIALAVGVLLREYNHNPPWISEVVSRLQTAINEV